MAHPALRAFVERMDGLVAATADAHEIAGRASGHLSDLLAYPEFLEPRFGQGSEEGYRQHCVHVHPGGLYSLVSLVWFPGQRTPIHDHRCWCVVGVLEGDEEETRYSLHAAGGEQWLVAEGTTRYRAGNVCRLVPPDENIHRVANAGRRLAISLHVYGEDIARVGSSINRVFDQPVRDPRPDHARTAASWRAADGAR